MERLCDHDPTRIYALDARFTAPVLPGETIVTEMWRDGDTVSFRCRVAGRDMIAIDNGRCMIGPARCSGRASPTRSASRIRSRRVGCTGWPARGWLPPAPLPARSAFLAR